MGMTEGLTNMADMHKVASSNIDSIGYDKVTSTLYISFLSSGMYKIHPVDEATFHAMEASKSKGKFYNSTIKSNPDYKIERV
jgi:hypothetical protein